MDSEVGRGSTFWFTVVLDRQQAATATADPRRPYRGGAERTAVRLKTAQKPRLRSGSSGRHRPTGHSTVRILLVEDNRANLRVTQALLEAIGCHCYHSAQWPGCSIHLPGTRRSTSFSWIAKCQ